MDAERIHEVEVDAAVADDQDERNEDDYTLGPCGCTDYHMADCPIRTGDGYDDPYDADPFDLDDGRWDDDPNPYHGDYGDDW